MKFLRLKLLSAGGAFALTASLALIVPAGALASGGGDSYICSGGNTVPGGLTSIPSGTYSSIVVKGVCAIDQGSVTVRHDVSVARGGELVAMFSGSDLTVLGNVSVARNGTLVVGCGGASDSVCFLDQGFGYDPTGAARVRIGRNLTSESALAVIVHTTSIGGNLTQTGGGGGVNCDPHAETLGGPAYSTYESSTIGGNATIIGVRSCWLGFISNTVHRNVAISHNVMADAYPLPSGEVFWDGNEVDANTIGGNLSCFGNAPAAQLGDHGGPLNTVGGQATGQCRTLKT